jgi:hypothetical protein
MAETSIDVSRTVLGLIDQHSLADEVLTDLGALFKAVGDRSERDRTTRSLCDLGVQLCDNQLALLQSELGSLASTLGVSTQYQEKCSESLQSWLLEETAVLAGQG